MQIAPLLNLCWLCCRELLFMRCIRRALLNTRFSESWSESKNYLKAFFLRTFTKLNQ